MQHFLQYINNFNPTVKFDFCFSDKSVNFLDTTIRNNKLQSDLYIKPTDKTLLLHQSSFHPPACKNAIIHSQALRYRRIITDNNMLQQRQNHLFVALIHRGYDPDCGSFRRDLVFARQISRVQVCNCNFNLAECAIG